MRRVRRVSFAVVASLLAGGGCSLLIDTSGLVGDDLDATQPPETGADAGGDALTFDGPTCPGTAGLQPTSPWPMRGGCTTHAGRSAYLGPTRTPSSKWVYLLPDAGTSYSGPSIAHDDTIYFGLESNTRSLVAVAPDGGLRWLAGGGGVFGPVTIGIDGTIYAAAGPYLHALSPAGGTLWRFNSGDEVDSCPAVDPDGTIVFGIYSGTEPAAAFAVNPDGGQRWRVQFSSHANTSPAVGVDGTTYVTTREGQLHAIKNGVVNWTYASAGEVRSSPAVGSDGTIYFGSRDSMLHAVAPTGERRWTYAASRFVDGSPAIAHDGTIYVGADDGKLHAVNPDGTPRWIFPAGGAIDGSITIGSEGTIYFGATDNTLYAVGADGAQRWTYTLPAAITGQPAIGRDGTLYVGTADARLHALAAP